jgi:disulfide oxidoreductase YuzD
MADVTIYEDPNFQGRSQVLAKGRYGPEQLSIGQDALSSLRVPQGLVVRIYEHFDFQGEFVDIQEDTPALDQHWNDRASSIVVYDHDEQPPVTTEVVIFQHGSFHTKHLPGWGFQILQEGKYDAGQTIGSVGSALVPYGMLLRLFENANFEGSFIDIWEDTPNVHETWDGRVSSIVVMVAFPENEIGIVRDYIGTSNTTASETVSEKIDAVRAALASVLSGGEIIQEHYPFPPGQLINTDAVTTRNARMLLNRFLDSLRAPLELLNDVYMHVAKQEFSEVAFMRFAMKRSRSGLIVRSSVETA